MTPIPGRFVWYDLMTTDAPAAAEFYGAVMGWTAADAGLADRSYTIFSAGLVPVAGMIDMPQAARDGGALPSWSGYIAVSDVDAIAAQIVAKGGATHRAPDDIPGVGRFAIMGDPQGAAFSLFKPLDQSPPPPPPAGTPGTIGWHELGTTDWPTALTFYADLFGWTKTDAVEMGPMGTYQLFATGDLSVGGMMNCPAAQRPPSWTYYVNVEEINTCVARVKAAGGQVINGPMQVPGGSWIANCLDPQGAAFAVVAPGSSG
jgi:predicted enzyme related to lactoylglutathione lyase